MRIRLAVKGLPWRGIGAALLTIAAGATLMGGAGYALLAQEFGPRSAAIGGALMGVACVCAALVWRLVGPRE